MQRVFEPALHHSDAVVFAARQAAEELVAGLAAVGRVCTQVLVVVETEHGEVLRLDAGDHVHSPAAVRHVVERRCVLGQQERCPPVENVQGLLKDMQKLPIEH